MKKTLFLGMIVLLVVALFIASCVPVARYYVCPDGRQVLKAENCNPPAQIEEVSSEPETEPVTEIKEEPEVVEKQITPEAQELFDKFSKVNSVQYTYVESPNALPQNIYYASRTQMKVFLATKVKFTPTDMYDTVYLDLVNKEAIAYCEDRSVCDDLNKPIKVDYDQYFVETPFDWMDKINKANFTGRSKTLEDRKALELDVEVDGVSGIMYADAFFSFPLTFTLGDNTYSFTNIVINEAGEKDFEHQVPG